MGGSQSTRTIEVLNESNTIRLTEDAQRRLVGQPDNGRNQRNQELTPQQIENVKEEIEDVYRQRMREAETQFHRVTAQEFARAVEEVEDKFLKQTGSINPVCQDLQQEVYECYQKNQHQPLNCSRQVSAFTEAVARYKASEPKIT